MNINLIYDSSTTNAPAGFAAAMNYVVTFFDTVSETAASPGYTYSQMKNALTANTAQSATDLTALANLPASDPTSGGLFFIGPADAKALGLISGGSMGIDGWIGFDNAPNTFTFDPNNRAMPGLYDFIGVAFHEVSRIMGRVAGLNMFGGYSVLDLFRSSGACRRARHGCRCSARKSGRSFVWAGRQFSRRCRSGHGHLLGIAVESAKPSAFPHQQLLSKCSALAWIIPCKCRTSDLLKPARPHTRRHGRAG